MCDCPWDFQKGSLQLLEHSKMRGLISVNRQRIHEGIPWAHLGSMFPTGNYWWWSLSPCLVCNCWQLSRFALSFPFVPHVRAYWECLELPSLVTLWQSHRESWFPHETFFSCPTPTHLDGTLSLFSVDISDLQMSILQFPESSNVRVFSRVCPPDEWGAMGLCVSLLTPVVCREATQVEDPEVLWKTHQWGVTLDRTP